MRKTNTILGSVLGVGVLVTALVSFAPPAAGDTDLNTMSPSNPSVEYEFDEISGLYPVQAGPQAFALYRPPACETANYCETHAFAVDIPPGYDEIYGVNVTLTWPNPSGNQLTLHVWPDDDPVDGAPMGPCSTPVAAECQGEHPLSFGVVEPTVDPGEPATVWVTVVNAQGSNDGYTLRLDWFEIEMDRFPHLDDDRFRDRTAPAQTGGPDAADTPRRPQLFADDDAPGPAAQTVLVPGPDGELMEIEIPTLAAGIYDRDEGSGVNPFITAAVVLAVVAGLSTYLVIRRRREAVR